MILCRESGVVRIRLVGSNRRERSFGSWLPTVDTLRNLFLRVESQRDYRDWEYREGLVWK